VTNGHSGRSLFNERERELIALTMVAMIAALLVIFSLRRFD
jgi:hypothetical protein